jgi:hypothetical protein
MVAFWSFAYFFNACVTKDTSYLYILVSLFCGIVSPGVNIVFSNVPYLNMPRENQTNYLSFYSTAVSLSSMLGSTVSRWFITATEGKYIVFFGVEMQNKQYINLISWIIMLIISLLLFIISNKQDNRIKKADT